ncbi:FecR family protein [Mucilaginibacter auburnensis]|uniref:FecR protein n=1 Tax=Mucilaginibacter auburnensis TaxID=1457233 RepID=A0A2H9VWB1_9SPHI|nr:FecR family protein [Mucilaginibacter auburnensis]PJJ85091.1 FecR protein [Mucilaginibacter auburnensis]
MQYLSKEKIQELSDKWLKGTITADELAVLEDWYNSHPNKDINWTAGDWDEKQLKERLYYNIQSQLADELTPAKFNYKKILYSAAAMVTLAIGALYLYSRNAVVKEQELAANPVIVSTGNLNKATLTLSDGRIVELNGATNGIIASDAGTDIRKTANGEILYSAGHDEAKSNAVAFNTISTPKGGQFQISLPDGSKVWLNALSAVKFPAVFKGKERLVELTGEAYFEVAKNREMPFKVKMPDGTLVEVLGTHFNIAAYPGDKSVDATLLEGSIDIQKGNIKKLMVPGEMAEVTDKIQLRHVNVEDAVSWKNGLFRFDNASVSAVMREMERWYGVEVVYSDGMPDNEITGYISRNAKLEEVLKMLELSDVRTKQQGNKIIVLKN